VFRKTFGSWKPLPNVLFMIPNALKREKVEAPIWSVSQNMVFSCLHRRNKRTIIKEIKKENVNECPRDTL